MPLDRILGSLLSENRRAVGALFLDESGETVDLACSELTPYQVRVVGAYLSIYLRQLEKFSGDNGLGEARMIHIEKDGIHIYTLALPDGYHVALLQRRPALAAQAARTLERAGDALRREFF